MRFPGGAAVGEGEAVNIKAGYRVTFRDVKAKNAEQDGFDLDGGADLALYGCVAEDCWGSGLHMVAEGVSRVIVDGCRFLRNGFGRRSSTEGGGGRGANGAGADYMGNNILFNNCIFENNAVEAHQLAGYNVVFSNCAFNHSPASTVFPSANTLPSIIVGWTALGALGGGDVLITDSTLTCPATLRNVEVMQAFPNTTIKNCQISSGVLVTSGKNVNFIGNYINPGGGSYDAINVILASGKVTIKGNIIESYASGVRVDSAQGGILEGNTFISTGAGPVDANFVNTGAADNWNITQNIFSSLSTHGIKFNYGQGGMVVKNNTASAATGFAILLNGGCTSNVIDSNHFSTVGFASSSDSGNVIVDNLISGTITHSGTSTFAINTWRRNTGAGCLNVFYGTATLASGTATVSTAVANSARKFGFSRQVPNASTGIGNLALGTVTAQTSFVVNALNDTATVATGDLSSVYWEILE